MYPVCCVLEGHQLYVCMAMSLVLIKSDLPCMMAVHMATTLALTLTDLPRAKKVLSSR